MQSKPWGRTKPPVGSPVDWSDPINANLKLCYLLNEGAGLNVKNATGDRLFDGTGSGANFGPGSYGTAWVQPNSGTPVITGPSNTAFRPATFVTHAVDVVLGVQAREQGFVSITENGNYQEIGINGGSPPNGFWVITTGGGTTQVTSPATYAVGTRLTVVGTYDGANMYLYINGALSASSAKTGNLVYNAQNIYVGSENTRFYFAGTINWVRSWTRALKASEAMRLYSEPFAGIVAPKRRIVPSASALPPAGTQGIFWIPNLDGMSGGSIFPGQRVP